MLKQRSSGIHVVGVKLVEKIKTNKYRMVGATKQKEAACRSHHTCVSLDIREKPKVKVNVEVGGIEPPTSCMLSTRSAN